MKRCSIHEGMSGTFEEDYELLKSQFEGPRKRNKDPNLVVDLVYKMRFAKNGVVWHSWVDPNRPDSPPVEWPEYPNDAQPSDIPEDGILGHKTDADVLSAMRKSNSDYKNPYKPIIGKTDSPCGNDPGVEDPEIHDEDYDPLDKPRFPGLYPGEQHPAMGAGGLYWNDSEDEYNY